MEISILANAELFWKVLIAIELDKIRRVIQYICLSGISGYNLFYYGKLYKSTCNPISTVMNWKPSTRTTMILGHCGLVLLGLISSLTLSKRVKVYFFKTTLLCKVNCGMWGVSSGEYIQQSIPHLHEICRGDTCYEFNSRKNQKNSIEVRIFCWIVFEHLLSGS